jgi:hypothetical protein
MDDMRERVIRYYAWVVTRQPEYMPLRMAELAPGIVAVEDRAGECDAIFDMARWKYTMPEIWARGTDMTKAQQMEAAGLEVLPGIGRFPAVVEINGMMEFARRHLSPIGDTAWHQVPQFFPITA